MESTKNLAKSMFYAGQVKAQAIPEGFVLVPKEPTEKMLDAARHRQWDDFSSPLEDMDVLKYKAMIEAAQEPAND